MPAAATSSFLETGQKRALWLQIFCRLATAQVTHHLLICDWSQSKCLHIIEWGVAPCAMAQLKPFVTPCLGTADRQPYWSIATLRIEEPPKVIRRFLQIVPSHDDRIKVRLHPRVDSQDTGRALTAGVAKGSQLAN